MRNLLDEFKAFINKGDVVTIAVGLVMALYFKAIVDQVIDGVITPVLAAIVGEETYEEIGFDLGDAFISVGLVLGAIIDFLVVAFVLFMVVRAYNRWKGRGEEEVEADPAPTAIELLTEIRDSLRANR